MAPSNGSPALDRTILPIPDPSFKGTAAVTLAGSKADFPEPISAPEGAPNVLLVLIDDAGFGEYRHNARSQLYDRIRQRSRFDRRSHGALWCER